MHLECSGSVGWKEEHPSSHLDCLGSAGWKEGDSVSADSQQPLGLGSAGWKKEDFGLVGWRLISVGWQDSHY